MQYAIKVAVKCFPVVKKVAGLKKIPVWEVLKNVVTPYFKCV
jgi:hypothetical protein